MTGCIPLHDDQIELLAKTLSPRDRLLFILGLTTGFRITELLSLRVGDVWQNGEPSEYVHIQRRNTKKKVEGKSKRLHILAKAALKAYMEGKSDVDENVLFSSRKGNLAISRRSAWRIIRQAAQTCGIGGKVGTHSMRKTYARKAYQATNGDYMKVKLLLGHKSVASTEAYLQFIQAEEVEELMNWQMVT